MSFRKYRLIAGTLAAAIALTLSACATEGVAQPNVMALPKQGESFDVFAQHDATCRQFAAAQTGGQSPGQAATESGVARAAAGTVVGAAAGALFGSAFGHAGDGAAIGAGSGLLAGGLLGSASGRNAASSTQNHYDTAYTQCMVGNGELIAPPTTPAPPVVYRPGPPVIYVPAPGYVPAPPPAYPPAPPATSATQPSG